MPDLAAFQLAFAAAMAGSGACATLERQPGFAVYRNTGPAALIDALRAAYPVAAEIVGDEAFGEIAFAYACAHPPADSVLLRYGRCFADFLAASPLAAELPYLADVAAIERLRSEALDAADAPPLGLRDLARAGEAGWAGLRLPLHPATRLDWLSTPAFTIWRAHREGFETLAPDWHAEGVLVVRRPDAVAAYAIDAPEHRLLFGLRLGETVGQAMAATASAYPDADLGRSFARLVNRGAFTLPPQLQRN
jgi:hypothetical protein